MRCSREATRVGLSYMSTCGKWPGRCPNGAESSKRIAQQKGPSYLTQKHTLLHPTKNVQARLKGTGKSAAPSPLSSQPSQNMVIYHEAMSMKAKTARDKKYKTYLKLLAIDTSNFNEKEKRHDNIMDQITKDLAEE